MILAHSVAGAGPAVVFLHGLFGSGDNLRGVSRRLEDEFLTIRLDLTHHGDSPHAGHFSYHDIARDVRDTLDAIGVDTFSVLGHSLGGKTGMTLALQSPDRVERLIVADIAPRVYASSHSDIFEGMELLESAQVRSRSEADSVLSEKIPWPYVRAFLLKSTAPDADGVYHWKLNLPVLKREYPVILGWPETDRRYKAPVLVIRGGQSQYIPENGQDLFYTNFPLARLVTLENAGHWVHAEDPEGFMAHIRPFLREDVTHT
jgi:esterase